MDYKSFTDDQLRAMHIADRNNSAIYEERLRRDKRKTIRVRLIFIGFVAAALVLVGFLLETFKDATVTAPPIVGLVVIWGIIGLMFLRLGGE